MSISDQPSKPDFGAIRGESMAPGSNGPPKPQMGTAGSLDLDDFRGIAPLDEPRVLCEIEIKSAKIDKNNVDQLALTHGKSARQMIEGYVRNRMEEENGNTIARIGVFLVLLKRQKESLDKVIRKQSETLSGIPQYVGDGADAPPWTTVETVEEWALGCVAVLMVLLGCNTSAQILQSTGIAGFEYYWKAFLFSAIPPFFACTIHGFGAVFRSPRGRVAFTAFTWAAGFVFGLCWIVTYAKLFPALGQTPADIIKELTASSADSDRKYLTQLFIVFSMLCESFIAAACILTMTGIARRHESTASESNPVYQRIERELNTQKRHLFDVEQITARLEGKQKEFARKTERLIQESLIDFDTAVAAAEGDQAKQGKLNAFARK